MRLKMEYGDTNFIGMVNAEQYQGFVSEDWELDGLLQHFADETQAGRILVMQMTDEGMEHSWQVEVLFEATGNVGPCYRRAEGYIQVTDQRLYLVDYDCLTMAAQFEEEKVPDTNCADYGFELRNGIYKVDIVQFYNADQGEHVGRDDVDLLLNLTAVARLGKNEQGVIWCSYL